MKKLGLWIPLGTLLVLLVALVIARSTRTRESYTPIRPAPGAEIAALEFPVRDASLAGHVVGDAGEPIEQALVWLRVEGELSFTETDAQGAFHFERVQHGERRLGVLATAYAPQRFVLTEGAEARLVLDKQRPPPPSLPPQVRATLTGHVEMPGVDRTGYQVSLAPRDPPETLGAPIPVRARCDANGTFTFEDLLAGDYRVELFPPWAADGSWPDLLRGWKESQHVEWHHGPGGAGGGPRELVLTPVAGAIVGSLHDASQAPLEAALVLVTPSDDPARPWPPVSSGAGGEFRCGDLPPGKYALSVRAGADWVQLEVEVGPQEAHAVDVRPLDVAKAPR